MIKCHYQIVIFSILCILAAANAKAATTPWIDASEMSGRMTALIDDHQPSEAGNDTVKGVLQFRMKPGWHIYWRNPGDAGLAPQLTWTLPEQFGDAVPILHYPAPNRFKEIDLTVFGYKGQVSLPFEIMMSGEERSQAEEDGPLPITLDAKVLICKNICIPQDFSFVLDVGQAPDLQDQSLINAAWRDFPLRDERASLRLENFVAGPDALVLDVISSRGFDEFDVFVELDKWALTHDYSIVRKDEGKSAQIIFKAPDDVEDFSRYVQDKTIRITMTNGRDVIERQFEF